MSIVSLLVVLVLIGVGLYLVSLIPMDPRILKVIPMDPRILKVIQVVAILLVVLWVVESSGLLGDGLYIGRHHSLR